MVEPLDLTRLQEPFPANEIEWRVQQCGRGRTSNRIYARVPDKGRYRGRLPERDGGQSFRWDPPELPVWALPGGEGSPPAFRAA